MGSPLKKPVINLFEREDSGELLERVRTLIRNRYEQWSEIINLDELVLDVMVKISDGEIQRKLPAGISLDTYVYQTSRSVLTHRLRRKKKSVPLDEALSLGGAEMIWDQLVFHMLTNCMLDIVSGDPTLTKIVVIWSECPDMKPNEVALKLGIPIEEMRCAQVRLRGILLRKGADQWLPKRKK